MKNRIKEFLINNRISKSLMKFARSNCIAETIAIFIFWIIALIPVYIYLLLRWFIEPIDFWQELALFLVCALTIGWLQVILAFFAFVLTVRLITEGF